MTHYVNHREALGFWLNQMGLLGEVAEIGCARGHFARTVLEQWKGRTYHMIDPWSVQDKDIYRENQETETGYENWYQDCVALAKEDPRVRLVRQFSPAASEEFQAGQLDMAYIDGNHAYAAVMADMDAWWPKVRLKGIMAGHDYTNKTDEGWWAEVEPAVNRWAKEHNVSFCVTPCTSWWIYKDRA